MKITRELIDNGQKIIHVNYEKKDLEKLEKLKKLKAEEEPRAKPERDDA